jgi:hypothetical protein
MNNNMKDCVILGLFTHNFTSNSFENLKRLDLGSYEECGSWRTMKTIENTSLEFPNAFSSCDTIYSNKSPEPEPKKSKVYETPSNTLFVEIFSLFSSLNSTIEYSIFGDQDIIKFSKIFENFSGFIGVKSTIHHGKNICFVTFDSVKNATISLGAVRGFQNLGPFNDNIPKFYITYAKSATRDFH